jgi:hypothetical protein
VSHGSGHPGHRTAAALPRRPPLPAPPCARRDSEPGPRLQHVIDSSSAGAAAHPQPRVHQHLEERGGQHPFWRRQGRRCGGAPTGGEVHKGRPHMHGRSPPSQPLLPPRGWEGACAPTAARHRPRTPGAPAALPLKRPPPSAPSLPAGPVPTVDPRAGEAHAQAGGEGGPACLAHSLALKARARLRAGTRAPSRRASCRASRRPNAAPPPGGDASRPGSRVGGRPAFTRRIGCHAPGRPRSAPAGGRPWEAPIIAPAGGRRRNALHHAVTPCVLCRRVRRPAPRRAAPPPSAAFI